MTDTWKPTHYSNSDGSTVRLVQAEPFTIENEDGEQWVDDPTGWSPIENVNDKLAAMTDEERAKLVDEISTRVADKMSAREAPRKCVVILDDLYVEGKGYVPTVVTEGEAGHSPLVGSGELSEPWYWGNDKATAEKIADDFNTRLGVTRDDVTEIVISSIGAQNRQEQAKARVDQKLRRTSIYAVDPRTR